MCVTGPPFFNRTHVEICTPPWVKLTFEKRRFFKENQRISKDSNQSNEFKTFILLHRSHQHLAAFCCAAQYDGCTKVAQVLWRIRATFRQRHTMMHQRCFDIPAFCHAHLTERIPHQLHRTDRMPCGGMVPLLVRRVTVETVVVPVCFLPVLRAELAIRQVWAAGILAGL